MRLIRELSLLLNIIAGLIIVVWGLYKLIAAIIPGLGNIVDFVGRNFFTNSAIPVPVRLAVPMLVLGIILFFLSGSQKKEKDFSEELDSPRASREK